MLVTVPAVFHRNKSMKALLCYAMLQLLDLSALALMSLIQPNRPLHTIATVTHLLLSMPLFTIRASIAYHYPHANALTSQLATAVCQLTNLFQYNQNAMLILRLSKAANA
jgi:hypothetical protein